MLQLAATAAAGLPALANAAAASAGASGGASAGATGGASGDLNQAASVLAAEVRAIGAGPEGLVGIYCDRSLEMFASMRACPSAAA